MIPRIHTCRFCKEMDRDYDLIQYGTRHWAHDTCYLDAGKKIDGLPASVVGQFRVIALREHGLLKTAKQIMLDKKMVVAPRGIHPRSGKP